MWLRLIYTTVVPFSTVLPLRRSGFFCNKRWYYVSVSLFWWLMLIGFILLTHSISGHHIMPRKSKKSWYIFTYCQDTWIHQSSSNIKKHVSTCGLHQGLLKVHRKYIEYIWVEDLTRMAMKLIHIHILHNWHCCVCTLSCGFWPVSFWNWQEGKAMGSLHRFGSSPVFSLISLIYSSDYTLYLLWLFLSWLFLVSLYYTVHFKVGNKITIQIMDHDCD